MAGSQFIEFKTYIFDSHHRDFLENFEELRNKNIIPLTLTEIRGRYF